MIRIALIAACSLLFSSLLSSAQEDPAPPRLAYPHHQPSGNRIIDGQGTFPAVTAHDFTLNAGHPAYVVGLAAGEGILWSLSTETQALDVIQRLDSGEFLEMSALPTGAAEAVPPVLRLVDDLPLGLRVPPGSSRLTHPVALPESERFLHISQAGELVLFEAGQELDRLSLDVQPDARPVISADGRIALYVAATDQRYVHGIMGDDLEGTALLVLRTVEDRLQTVVRVDLPGDAVYEGLSPLWADVDGDGSQDVLTTVSDGSLGSRIRAYVFAEDTLREVDGPPIGQPFRWQHQLAWGAFAPDGTPELVEVLTPHIGGVVRFYQFTGDALTIVAQQPGYTSHVIGSRNLDMAVAGDFNGDGLPEIVLPSQDRTRIAGIQRTEAGAAVDWELPVDGLVASNLAAVRLPDGTLALAVGTQDGRLRVWLP